MNPLPYGQRLWLLLPLVPGIALLARWLLSNLPRLDRRILSGVLAYVILIIFTHIASLETHCVYWGLPFVVVPLGLAGYIAYYFSRPPREELPERLPSSFWIIYLLSTALLIAPIFCWNFYDELSVPGHQSTPSQILNAYYPPVYLAQPSIELRYHYGVDLLIAITQLLLHIRIDQANDVVTLGLWLLLIPAIWLCGERLLGPGVGKWAAILVPWGAGLTFLAEKTNYPLMTGFRLHDTRLALPLMANFFQRPWAVGTGAMCLLVLLLHYFLSREKRDARALVGIGIIVLALPILEAAVFATTLLACGIYLLTRFIAKRELRVLEAGIVMLVAAVAARWTHGFFIPDARGLGLGLVSSLPTGGIAHQWGYSFLWNLLTFGFRLPLGIVGLWWGTCRLKSASRVGVWSLALILAISMVMLNGFQYLYTPDIIKFATLVGIPLSFGTAVIMDRWWRSCQVAKIPPVIFTIVLTAQSVIFMGALWTHHLSPASPAMTPYWTLRYPISDDDAAAISYLRKVVRPPQNLYRMTDFQNNFGVASQYSAWGGLPIVWPQFWDKAMGMSDETLNERIALRAEAVTLQPNPARSDAQIDAFIQHLHDQGVVWFVVGDEDSYLIPWLAQTAQETNQFGSLRVFILR